MFGQPDLNPEPHALPLSISCLSMIHRLCEAVKTSVVIRKRSIYSDTKKHEIRSPLFVQDQVGEVLRKAGVSVVTTAVCNVSAFLAAALIPIPALR